MAHDTIDAVVVRLGVKARCRTRNLPLLGAKGFRAQPAGSAAAHLDGRYGAQSGEVQRLVATDAHLGRPLVPGLPYLRAEAVYAVRAEMAITLDDVLTRRTRARLLDRAATVAAAPAVAALLAPELGWDAAETQRQIAHFLALCAAEDAAAHTSHVAPAEAAT